MNNVKLDHERRDRIASALGFSLNLKLVPDPPSDCHCQFVKASAAMLRELLARTTALCRGEAISPQRKRTAGSTQPAQPLRNSNKPHQRLQSAFLAFAEEPKKIIGHSKTSRRSSGCSPRHTPQTWRVKQAMQASSRSAWLTRHSAIPRISRTRF
eukprot:6198566-Pleurochrysis_carterae.AAC.9